MAADSQAALVNGLIAAAPVAALSLSDRERALVAYADKLTQAPASIRAGDIEALRSHGLPDLAIHDACAIVAYFAFVNRIADGLGVELEDKPSAGV
ncbi:MAG TPA: hypothetical protein VGA78_16030 [Gemmatimonadales bacterium]